MVHIAATGDDIPLKVVGLIRDGDEAGRYVEVIDDSARTGGYLIFTYADRSRSPGVFDAWVKTFQNVEQYFAESGWLVDWGPPSP